MKIQVDNDNSLTKRHYLKHKTLEEYLKALSSLIPDNLRSVTIREGISTKRDDTTIPVKLWLYWLNTGFQVELNLYQWQKNIVVLQEKFLVLR